MCKNAWTIIIYLGSLHRQSRGGIEIAAACVARRHGQMAFWIVKEKAQRERESCYTGTYCRMKTKTVFKDRFGDRLTSFAVLRRLLAYGR